MHAIRARKFLRDFNFRSLFVEELGWDKYSAPLSVVIGNSTFDLSALAEKRGMVVFHCPTPNGKALPDYALRRRIEQVVAKTAHEHLIIFTDTANTTQIWQWVKREPSKPVACREHAFHQTQSGDALLQKIEAIAFALDEEEGLTLTDVTRRTRAGFDVERLTKQFYDRFQKEHAALLKFIKGITEAGDREWYASVMLNRLMFVYFIQRKGFLDGDRNYLRNRLMQTRNDHGQDKFYSFYRYFLLRLFHEGLGGRERSADLESLVGRIPYLNGGLFDLHELERPDRYGGSIEIADAAFERIFDYFDQYQWHLDERPLKDDNEINPDVLGHIFEKYVNQKQMGAYYTKEDITEYIAKNTVLPFLFEAARLKCKSAFDNPNGQTVWSLLEADPDRYIYGAVRHGVEESLPPELAKALKKLSFSVDDHDKIWSKVPPDSFALPSETWREVAARRDQYKVVTSKLAANKISAFKDLISLNLDVRQFAQDVIESCEKPELLRAFWQAVEKVTILDPTCGSGAFLFAALNVLEPLYEACLDRMQAFIDDENLLEKKNQSAERLTDFRRVLAHVAAHPNRRYFIFKSIILNNLFGVDVMEEAVEICKLRLFLKLAAQVEPDSAKENLGIEPLPDIDFNIRAGNTLVGYANYNEVRTAVGLDLGDAMAKIDAKAADLQKTFDGFRQGQTHGDGTTQTAHKSELHQKLKSLNDELNRHLVSEYGIKSKDKAAQSKWLKSHQPFHWFVEFYGTVSTGGFDVIIGNPPYAEVPQQLSRALLRHAFKTALDNWSRDEDLYTMVVERSLSLLKKGIGQFGMILPLSLAFSTKKPFVKLRQTLATETGLWLWSHFDRIPSALFGSEVRTRCTIAMLSRSAQSSEQERATTALLRWTADYRDYLFKNLQFACFDFSIAVGIPKLSSQLQADVLKKLLQSNAPLGLDTTRPISFNELSRVAPKFPQPGVYIGGTAYNWFPAWRDIPRTTNLNGQPSLPARTAGYRFSTEEEANIVFALLCSSLGYWWWAVASDGFNLKKWLLERFPISISMVPKEARKALADLGANLRRELARNYVYKDNKGRIGNFYLPACRTQTEAIDALLSNLIPILSAQFFEDVRRSNASFSRAQANDIDNENTDE